MIELLVRGMTLGLNAGLSPGPLQTYIIQTSLLLGWRRSLIVALSPLITDVPIILISLLLFRALPPWLESALTLFGAIFLFYLGDTALRANNLAQAESRYVEVMKMQPENAMALNNVAWLYLRQGKPGARAIAEKAVRNAPNLPAARDTYAMILAADRAFPQAIEESRRALALSGDAPGFRLNLARIYLDAGDRKAARAELDVLAKLGDKFPAQFEVERLIKRAEGS